MAAASWSAVQRDAAELAADVGDLLVRWSFAYAGTIRRDGTPRISPVEVHLLGSRLVVVLIPGTAKARDLDRDQRLTLQTPILNPAEPGAEVKLRGRIALLPPADHSAISDAIASRRGWRPGDGWMYCEVLLSAVALIEWTAGDMILRRWTAMAGSLPPERRSLDTERGRYVTVPAVRKPRASDRSGGGPD